MTGGWRSGRERKFHACPAGADAAVARARGAGSQPRGSPSTTHTAAPPAACRNLLRVNLELKSAPLSRSCTGYFFTHLPEVTQGTLLHPTLTTASHSLPRLSQQRGVPGPLSYDEVDESAWHVDALA